MNTDLTPAPTPQTDATQKLWKTQIRIEEEIWDFARELERELLAAHKTAEELSGALREEQLKTQALTAAAKLVDQCFHRTNHSQPDLLGDDEHEAWTAIRSALTGGTAD